MCESDLFSKWFTEESLTKIYLKYIHYSSSTGIDGVRANDKFNYENEITFIINKIKVNKYKFSKYKEKLILKGAGKKPRVISIPTIRDRIVIKAMHLFLQSIFPECSKTLIPQLMLNKISKDIKENRYKNFAKIDIKEFYPSIDHSLLITELELKLKDITSINLIKSIITNKTGREEQIKGIPQGLSISNLLAEIYLAKIDTKYINNKEISYNRYVDDVLILSELTNITPTLNDIISDFEIFKLTCHNYNKIGSKTTFGKIDSSFDFLGYFFSNRILTVKKESIFKVEDSIAKIINSYKYIKTPNSKLIEQKINLRITGCIFEGKRRGWIFYYSQLEDKKILYKLDSTVKNMIKKSGLNGKVKPKSFSKTYNECSRKTLNNHKYIINFDGYSIEEKKNLLINYMDIKKVGMLDNDTIKNLFNKRIRHLVKDLERDTKGNS